MARWLCNNVLQKCCHAIRWLWRPKSEKNHQIREIETNMIKPHQKGFFLQQIFDWLIFSPKSSWGISRTKIQFHFYIFKCPVHYIFRFSYFGQNDQKRKNQLYCLCLKVTADFRNFVAKTDENRKTKDEMNRTSVCTSLSSIEGTVNFDISNALGQNWANSESCTILRLL